MSLTLLSLPAIDAKLVIAGALVGLLVGLTGMGGGALLTPLLVLVFKVPPLAAVSSDLVVSLVMKPFGGAVHLARGTVNKPILTWLVIGSVPTAFIGSMIIGQLGHGSQAATVQSLIKIVIAVALIASVLATVARIIQERHARRTGKVERPLVIRPVPTLLIGAIGGLAVGLTSVGAGTLIIALLLMVYPQLPTKVMVGTDIVQAIPLVGAAALGHLLFGDVQFSVTASLLIGAIPAVLLGARFSSAATPRVLRPVMGAVLAGSALALFGVPPLAMMLGAAAVAGLLVLLGGPAHDAPDTDAPDARDTDNPHTDSVDSTPVPKEAR